MAQSPVTPPVDGKRKWFDLQTTRGWIETVGALVTVNIGYAVEQHEHRLKAREQELREAFQATLGQSEERRHTIEREL